MANMSIEARELYCYCTGTHGQRFDGQRKHGLKWIRNLVVGCAQQYVYDYCSKGDHIHTIWTDDDLDTVAKKIMAE